jgi:8-oxo-dGTP pyrophosphatase MutT (NUDIX family)
MKKQILFSNKWINVLKLDDWFVATEPATCYENTAVAVLPWRNNKQAEKKQYLARFELNPAHLEKENEHQLSIITGACETENILFHAQQELIEEAGYHIAQKRFEFHGVVRPLKTSVTEMCLFSIEIKETDIQQEYHGDGTENEKKEFVKWVSYEDLIGAKDPYIHTILLRM